MKQAKNQYQKIYDRLNALGILDVIDHKDGHFKMQAKGFMDLCIDYQGQELEASVDGVQIISMTHYYEQNGDLCPDPDMQIRVYAKWGVAEALTYQDSFGFRKVYHSFENGDVGVDRRAKKELNTFLIQWLKNIKMQGHTNNEEQGQSPAPDMIISNSIQK